jgi:hypothetical protein
MSEKQNQQQNPMGKIIAKALKDESYKKKLIADPAAVLKAEGVEVPEGITLKAVADTENTRHIVVPALSGELSDEEIARVAGGGCIWGSDACRDSCKKCGVHQDWC